MTRDITIQTTKDSEVVYRQHDPTVALDSHDPGNSDQSEWLRFGADQSIDTKTIDVENDERAEYGSRDVEGRELVNVSGDVSISATATHWFHIQAWLTGFAAGTDPWDFETDGAQKPVLLDIAIANTASGEDYVFGPCLVDFTCSASDPQSGGGDGDVNLSFDVTASNVAKATSFSQAGDRTVTTFDTANPMYFKGALVDVSNWPYDKRPVLTEFEFSVTNNGEGIGQIPVTDRSGTVNGGLQDVTRTPGARDFEFTRSVFRIADETDADVERTMSGGVIDGSAVTTPDLTVNLGSGIRDSNGDLDPGGVHEVQLSFTDLFPDSFEYSGFDERGGNITLDGSDMPTTMSAKYDAQGATNPFTIS